MATTVEDHFGLAILHRHGPLASIHCEITMQFYNIRSIVQCEEGSILGQRQEMVSPYHGRARRIAHLDSSVENTGISGCKSLLEAVPAEFMRQAEGNYRGGDKSGLPAVIGHKPP